MPELDKTHTPLRFSQRGMRILDRGEPAAVCVNDDTAEQLITILNRFSDYPALTAENVSLKALLLEAHDGLGKFGGYVMAARQKDNTCDYWNGLREEIAAVQELHNKLAAALKPSLSSQP